MHVKKYRFGCLRLCILRGAQHATQAHALAALRLASRASHVTGPLRWTVAVHASIRRDRVEIVQRKAEWAHQLAVRASGRVSQADRTIVRVEEVRVENGHLIVVLRSNQTHTHTPRGQHRKNTAANAFNLNTSTHTHTHTHTHIHTHTQHSTPWAFAHWPRTD